MSVVIKRGEGAYSPWFSADRTSDWAGVGFGCDGAGCTDGVVDTGSGDWISSVEVSGDWTVCFCSLTSPPIPLSPSLIGSSATIG